MKYYADIRRENSWIIATNKVIKRFQRKFMLLAAKLFIYIWEWTFQYWLTTTAYVLPSHLPLAAFRTKILLQIRKLVQEK